MCWWIVTHCIKSLIMKGYFYLPTFKNWFCFFRNFPFKHILALVKSILKNLRQIASQNLISLAGLMALAVFPDNSFLLDTCMSEAEVVRICLLCSLSAYMQDEVEWDSLRPNQCLLALSFSFTPSCLLGIKFKSLTFNRNFGIYKYLLYFLNSLFSKRIAALQRQCLFRFRNVKNLGGVFSQNCAVY